MARLKQLGRIYLLIATVFGLWAMIVLQFKECGFFGTACTPVITQLTTVVIAFFRGITWLPELIIALLRGQVIDWLLFRNVYDPQIRLLIQSLWG